MMKRSLDSEMHGTLFAMIAVWCLSMLAPLRSEAWTVNPSDFRYDMSLYLSLASKDCENLDLYEIGAFIGDECRGVAETLDLPDGSSCLYMRIRSNSASAEEIVFKLRDKASDKTILLKGKDGANLMFKPDAMIGLPSDPYLLYRYFNVTVNAGENGSVAFEDGLYAETTVLEVTAVPDEGYRFDKWSDGNTDATRKVTVDGNIDLTATFSANLYNAVFKIDGEVIAELKFAFGAPVVAPNAPFRDGFIFTGWIDVPATMPAHDIEVSGAYAVSSYNVVFKIGDDVIAAYNLEYGAPIVPPVVPEKEGYTFAGWKDLPETMPANHIEIIGSYVVNSYKAVFKIGDEIVASFDVEYNSPVNPPAAPDKEGYAFTGWQNVPETMPPFDIEILGSYAVKSYNATFKIGSDIVAVIPVEFGASIIAPDAPTREGYAFVGWDGIPDFMPARDIEIEGSYKVNSYKAVFKIDNEIVATIDVEYNTPVIAPEAPIKEGYTFTGWQNVPATMPASDIEIVGSYAVKTFIATFKVGDIVVATLPVEYGATIIAPEAPVKEGYTFAGWYGIPTTMPAKDIEISGSYDINKYKVTFIIDGTVIAVQEVEYNSSEIVPPVVPAKEGHTFTGWQNVPATMPAFDVEILGTYAVNSYIARFIIGEDVVAEYPIEYGATVIAPEAPVKEGYTFAGWSGVPAVMPAQDIEIKGNYAINTYKAVFRIGDEVIATLDVEYNSTVTAPEVPAKEGHIFTGWQNVPSTMPAFDVEILGAYSVNSYNVIFKIDDEIIASYPVEYGAPIVVPEAPTKEGLIFDGWQNVPETMPANDIVILGSYSEDPNAVPPVETYNATFKIDGEVFAVLAIDFGNAIVAPEVPYKEGHTFSGWNNLPETMPAKDIEITGSYRVNIYKAVFKIGDEVISTIEVAYNTQVTAPEAPAKEGYTFLGWQNVPETMPPFDIEILGNYEVNTYNATFNVDNTVIAVIPFDYGAVVVAPEVIAMEGHTFAGWKNLPETMPAHDIEVNGSFTVNKYVATFKIGDEIIATMEIPYNVPVVAPEAPAKEGYTFLGWQNVPATMPPFDVEILGNYEVNTYNATFTIGDEFVMVIPFDYGSNVVAPDAPAKEGHTFAGWIDLPEIMPANDIFVSGKYNVNSYKAVFTIDGVVIAESVVEYNTPVVAPEAPVKEGFTFTGWQNVPETMPPFDIEILGSYVVNTYSATFKIDGEVVAVVPFDYGVSVVAPEVPSKEGHTFGGWSDMPETMPANDIVVNGSYTVNTYKAIFKIGDEVIETIDVIYNTSVPTPKAPEKEGYTFTCWQNVPETMPPFDIEILGSYAVNAYTVTFQIGEDLIAEIKVDYGAEIVAPEAPEKEGYSFAGWENIPQSMPAADIVILGSYNVNVYHLTVYLNDDIYMEEDIEFGAPVVIPEPELPENKKFIGWKEEIPSTMPAHDVVIHGEVTVSSGLATVAGEDTIVTVFDIHGVLLYKNVMMKDLNNRLTQGVYIINGKRVMVK